MLNLNELGEGLPAITPAYGKALAEACGICLESVGHVEGKNLLVFGDYEKNYSLSWPPVTEQALRCWNDPEVATEHGAVGIAVLLAKKEIGYAVIERSRKGTGFDYWMKGQGHVSHYLISSINQCILFACGDSFTSSDGIADARDRHPQLPGKLALGQAQLAGTPVTK